MTAITLGLSLRRACLAAVFWSGSALIHGPAVAASMVDDEGVSARIAPVARVQLAPLTSAIKNVPRTGEQLYASACSACHAAGVAGAPKLGDTAAWAPRLALGLDGLLKSAIKGKNAMPPKGGSDASDGELARAIVYMANKAGARFKEPPVK